MEITMKLPASGFRRESPMDAQIRQLQKCSKGIRTLKEHPRPARITGMG